MKILIFCIFLIFSMFNISNAETYVCKHNEKLNDVVETTIWERKSNDFFSLRLFKDDNEVDFGIYFEDDNVISLIAISADTSFMIAAMLNKNDLTYGVTHITQPFDSYDRDDPDNYASGKCDKL